MGWNDHVEGPGYEPDAHYFTFGFGQKHQNGYVIIYADDPAEARDKMMEAYGPFWAFQYDSAEAAGVERFNLQLVETIP